MKVPFTMLSVDLLATTLILEYVQYLQWQSFRGLCGLTYGIWSWYVWLPDNLQPLHC